MNKLFFLNLSIDQNWARGSLFNQLFANGNPTSLRLSLLPQNLAIYHEQFNPERDVVIVSQRFDKYWLGHFASLSKINSARVWINDLNPYYTEEWIEKFKSQVSQLNTQERMSEIIVAGNSDLELKMHEVLKSNITPQNLNFEFTRMNSKIWLYHWTRNNAVPFPQSEVVNGLEILELKEKKDRGDFIFKSDISSGGSGQLTWEKMSSLVPWIERQSLTEPWNQSRWLKQLKCQRTLDFSCFGSTKDIAPRVAEIGYDENGLSYRHQFKEPLSAAELNVVQSIYDKISKELVLMGYSGPFGFDGFKSHEGFFPIVDLNVRLTKTHLLYQSLMFWQHNAQETIIFRIRFINKNNTTFEKFWNHFCEIQKISNQGYSTEMQVSPIEVSGWMLGKSEITIAIGSKSERVIERVLSDIKGALLALAK